MTTATLNRTTFETSRALDFFSRKELTAQIGHPPAMWPVALVKELIDNSLDACETAGIAPKVDIVVEPDAVSVQDNGPGLPVETLKRSMDYAVRISDKAHYVSPSRGQLGNALKAVYAAPFVLDGEHGRVEITTGETVHIVDVSLDRVGQQPRIEYSTQPDGLVKIGSLVRMGIAGCLASCDDGGFYKLFQDYLAFNPHLALAWCAEGDQGDSPATQPDYVKWLPSRPTSAHWYTPDRLRGLIAAYVHRERNGGEALTVRGFVSEFAGLSGTAKQKKVTAAAGLASAHLHDLVDGQDIDLDRVTRLLGAMQMESRVVKPAALGAVGEQHLRAHLVEHRYVDGETTLYAKRQGTTDGLPYIVETAFGIYGGDYADCGREIIAGLNWSPCLRIPIRELHDALADGRVDVDDPVVVAVHLICPRLEYTDQGKTTLDLPDEIVDALTSAVESVTSRWGKAKRRADRQDRVEEREIEQMRRADRPMTIKEAAWQVMEAAHAEASDNGTLPANARQIMYKARGRIQAITGKLFGKNTDAYFVQQLLPDFIEEHPDLTASWDVVYDDRGHLVEPHTDRVIGLGTLAVRRYADGWCSDFSEGADFMLSLDVDTSGPPNRFAAVMLVEKEGFQELWNASRIALRYDLAIMSTKGMSTTAARLLVERLSAQGIPIYVLHDFDKAGFSILNTLRTDTRRYHFATQPRVIDLGLRLEDVEQMDLESERVVYSGDIDPRINLRDSGATEAECDFLVTGREHGGRGRWHGQRVEINAMNSRQCLDWLGAKFLEHDITKVVPDDAVLAKAYRRAVRLTEVQRAIDAVQSRDSDDILVPDDLADRVREQLGQAPTMAWDNVVADLAEGDTTA